jgi:hypothetical protein
MRPLPPVVKSFLACRELLEDVRGEHILIGPLKEILQPHFPCAVQMSFFAQLCDMNGTYMPSLQIRDMDDRVICNDPLAGNPAEINDPLKLVSFAFRQIPVFLPGPGRYEAVLLMNDEVAARHPIVVRPPN